MNKATIEFCDYTWNPIVGCQHECKWCWARKFHKRYFSGSFDTPQFNPDRLEESNPKLPQKRNYIASAISPDSPVIFVVDMGDIFSPGVQKPWIYEILAYVERHDTSTFLFLTKNPSRYPEFKFPQNVILGTSMSHAHNWHRLEPLRVMKEQGYTVFVNVEPLMSRMDMVDFSGMDFVVVGALTGHHYRPDRAWFGTINHPVVYYKRNLRAYFPGLKERKGL